MSNKKVPSEVFVDTLKFVGFTNRSRKRKDQAIFESPLKGRTFLMRIYDFNKIVSSLKDNVIHGNWITGINSASGFIRSFDPKKRPKSEASQFVYFSKNGRQLLRKNSPQVYEGPAVYKIPKKSFGATLRFKWTFHRAYRDYVAFTLSRLDADLMFGIDKELEFSMTEVNFAELVMKAACVTPQQNIAALNGTWNFKGVSGGRTTLVCENLL